ncbi:MAG: NINE protein [Halobacteria archaeon]
MVEDSGNNRTCDECGAELQPDDSFCRKCGSDIDQTNGDDGEDLGNQVSPEEENERGSDENGNVRSGEDDESRESATSGRDSRGPDHTEFCKWCGAEIPEGLEKCPECDNVLEDQESKTRRDTGHGPDEKYCSSCGELVKRNAEICPHCGVRIHSSTETDRVTAAIFAILLGGLGAHKFYLGKTGQGVLYLCFFWTLIPAIVGLIEGIIYLTESDQEFERKHID